MSDEIKKEEVEVAESTEVEVKGPITGVTIETAGEETDGTRRDEEVGITEEEGEIEKVEADEADDLPTE
jgi:hypothetical protein